MLMLAAGADALGGCTALLAGREPEALDAADDFGWTALLYAAHVGHLAAVDALLAAGADVEARNALSATERHALPVKEQTQTACPPGDLPGA